MKDEILIAIQEGVASIIKNTVVFVCLFSFRGEFDQKKLMNNHKYHKYNDASS
jgi:hypothetical protein